VPALPQRVDDLLPGRGQLRQRHHRRRPGEAVRVPQAGGTLVPVPGSGHPDEVLRSLLALSDVMSTGHHAAAVAGVKRGDTVAVVGDGAVGLCAGLASRRLGAERVIALSRHPGRQKVAREFGATDVVEARGDEAVQTVLELTGGIGADAALECVGTQQSIATAAAIARPGSVIGIVGVPHGEVPFTEAFFCNVGWRGGPAPARIYIPELLGDVLDGTINPGLVFDYETDLGHIADAYQAMDERRAIKSLIRIALRYTVTHPRPNESGPPAREFAASGHPPTAPVPVTETAANR
jgi:threonine dehydrogenase-like Zn-dependent dehydrogenase